MILDVPQPLERLATAQRVVALTFDGGGNDVHAQRVLDTLQRDGVPATFFLTGRWVRLYPQVARKIGRRPSWVVGDHTVDHADLTKVSLARARSEILAARAQIERATGRDPKPLFRFPYGYETPSLAALVRRLGFVDVRWSVDSWGWMGHCCQTASGVVRRVVSHLEPGAIVLMHLGAASDGATLDTDALPRLIRAIRARGYRFVTLKSVKVARLS